MILRRQARSRMTFRRSHSFCRGLPRQGEEFPESLLTFLHFPLDNRMRI